MHLYAKKVIENAKSLSVPTEKYHYPRSLIYKDVKIEPSFPVEKYKQYRPDIIIKSEEGESIAIEIVVTHDIDEVKIKLYQEQKFHCLRIDLSEFLKSSLSEIEDVVKKKILEEDKNKKWIWPQISNEFDDPQTESLESKDSSSNVPGGCVLYLPLIGGLIYTIYNLIEVLII